MKRNVLVFGSIAGLIVTIVMVCSSLACYNNPDFKGSMLLGYGSMLVAFAFIFVGVKNYRDKQLNGAITFGRAFLLGLLIALVGSTFYVVTWLIEYYCFIPDFMEKYAAHMINDARNSGASPAEIAQQVASIDGYREMYKHPAGVILMTYAEVLPVGLVVALISALVLKKKAGAGQPV